VTYVNPIMDAFIEYRQNDDKKDAWKFCNSKFIIIIYLSMA